MDIRVVFLGTPDFAVPSLIELASRFQVAGVVTQPDRPSGRGRHLVPSPVKATALDLGLEIYQPRDVNAGESLDRIGSWKPDLICVAAFGQILKPRLLDLPAHGCLNLHASLLPRWRGASPINAAILAGDSRSGVTIIKMGPGLDDGPILAQIEVEIRPDQTAGSLSDQLAENGARLLVQTIPPYLDGEITPLAQDENQATMTRLLKKNAGQLDFSDPADRLARMVRAYSPWPGTFTSWNDTRLIVHRARSEVVTSPGIGVLTRYDGYPAIGTSHGILILEELQLAGKKRAAGPDFLNGNPSWPTAQ